MWSIWGAHGPLGRNHRGNVPAACDGFPDCVMKQLMGLHLTDALQKPWLLFSQFSPPPSHTALFSILDGVRKKLKISLMVPAQLGKLGAHRLSLLSMGETTVQKGLSLHWAVLPYGKGNVGKVKLFLLHTPVCAVSGFCFVCFLLNAMLKLLCWTFGLLQRLSYPWVIVSVSVLLGKNSRKCLFLHYDPGWTFIPFLIGFISCSFI